MTDSLLCGWRVSSSLPLPELLPWTGAGDHPPDLAIAVGTASSQPADPVFSGPLLKIWRDGSSIFTIPAVAAYHIGADGRTVLVEPLGPSDSPSIRTFLFGTVLAILCQRRGLLPLHASCIRFEGPHGPFAIAFSGSSGAGKSTLAAAFLRHGYDVLTDDVAVLDMAGDRAIVLPSLPRLKLWRHSLAKMNRSPDSLERVREELDKYYLPLAGQFCSDALPLAAIFHITRVRDEKHVSREPLRGLQAVLHLGTAIYHDRTLMRFAGGQRAMLDMAIRFAARVPRHATLNFLDGFERLDALVAELAPLREDAR